MTRVNVSADRIAEFNTLFLTLDEKGQEAAIIILKSLEFAQSVMDSHKIMLANAEEGQGSTQRWPMA